MKRRIFLITHSMSRTGAPRVILNIANELDKDKYEVLLYNINSLNRDLYPLVDKKIIFRDFNPVILRLSKSKYYPFKFVYKLLSRFISIRKSLRKELIQFNPDLVIVNTIFHLFVSEITEELSIKTIRYVHELESYLYSLSEMDKMRLLTSTDKFWVCSEKVAKVLKGYYNISNSSIIYPLVNIGINVTKKKFSEKKTMKVISAGAINFRKGFDLWIETAIRTVEKDRNIEFEWYGKLDNEIINYYNHSMARLTEENKKNIKYMGEVESINDAMNNSDLFFLSSREDPFPIVVIEALAHGLITVGFNSGGIEEHTKNGTAFTVDPGEIDELSDLIVSIKNKNITIDENIFDTSYKKYQYNVIFDHINKEIERELEKTND